MIDAQVHPLSFRLANAAQSCVWYLAKTLLPTNLYAYYPLPVRTVDWTGAAIAAIVLAAITAAAWFGSRRQPAFAFGWAWFLLSLAPVLGIIQVGLAAHADRYAYVPHIGLLTALVWLVADGLEGFPYARALQAGLAGVFLLFFSELTWLQAGYWHDPRTLWAHALELDEANWFARYQAGIEALRAGEEDVALAHFERSKQLRPIDGEVNMILAMFYQRRERWDQAAVCYRRILQTEPDNAKALFNLAIAAQMLGRPDEAKAALLRCVALKLDDAFVRGQLGLIYLQEQKPELALQEFDAALERQPQNRVMLEQSAEALVQLKRYPAARARLEAALELAPGDVPLRLRLADVLELLGDPAAARRHYQRALEIDPENDDARRLLEKGSAGAIHKDAAPQ
jgi:tetratricopeptide (TPR) repeat protein